MVTWRNREKTTWKIKCFIFVCLGLLPMPVWIFLPVKTGSIGNCVQHVLGEGSVTWQFHAWMECSYIGCMRWRDDIHRSVIQVNESLCCQDKNCFKSYCCRRVDIFRVHFGGRLKSQKFILAFVYFAILLVCLFSTLAMSLCHHGAASLFIKFVQKVKKFQSCFKFLCLLCTFLRKRGSHVFIFLLTTSRIWWIISSLSTKI